MCLHFCLRTTGEPDQLRTQAEASALTRRQADGWGQEVEDGEHERRDDGDRDDLLQGGDTAGDDNHRDGNRETLQQILNNTRTELNDRQVHFVSVNGG